MRRRLAATTEPIYGQSSQTASDYCERLERLIRRMAGQVVVIARVMVIGVDQPLTLWTMREMMPCLATSGRCSHTRTPGAEVAIGTKGPRYSNGAWGFRSHISRCDAPPHRKNKIVTSQSLDLPPDCRRPAARTWCAKR